MKKIILCTLLSSIVSSTLFAQCNNISGNWVGTVVHQDPLHLLTCQYKAQGMLSPSDDGADSLITLNYSLDSGKIKKLCNRNVPQSTYTVECTTPLSDDVILHHLSGRGLTIPSKFSGTLKEGEMHVFGEHLGSKVTMDLYKQKSSK